MTKLNMSTYDIFHGVGEVMEVLGPEWLGFPTGSLYINGTGNDCDIVAGPMGDRAVEDHEFFSKHRALVNAGFASSSTYGLADEEAGVTNHPSGYRMLCYRKDHINLILVDKGADNWWLARELLIARQSIMGGRTTKRERVLVHAMLVDGYEQAQAIHRTLQVVPEDY